MLRRNVKTVSAAVLLALTSVAPVAWAQEPNAAQAEPTWSQEDFTRIVQEVRHQLLGLTNYSVFDWITFGVRGKTLILHGYASRPTLKDDAGRAVKNIKGIDKVENEIQVLPLSNFDDQIRAQLYTRLYTQPALRKYNANQGGIGRAMMPGMNIGGITQNPPLGFHAIHIIVNRGHVTLYGGVINESDSNIAYIQANGTPGVFSVDNDLVVQNAPKKGAR